MTPAAALLFGFAALCLFSIMGTSIWIAAVPLRTIAACILPHVISTGDLTTGVARCLQANKASLHQIGWGAVAIGVLFACMFASMAATLAVTPARRHH